MECPQKPTRAVPGRVSMRNEAELVPNTKIGLPPKSVKTISALLVWGMEIAPAAMASRDINLEESRFIGSDGVSARGGSVFMRQVR